ncbi:MAG: GGDEF domain-containing protein [Spirochaetales bacterium]|nr:GGDEF domain-containing protein [Spirochaetales bacterium]
MHTKKTKDIYIFTPAAVLLICAVALAYIPGPKQAGGADLIAGIEVFEDPSHAIDIESLQKANPGFLPLDKKSLYVRRSASSWWIKIALAGNLSLREDAFLHIPNASLELIDVWFSDGSSAAEGKKRPAASNEIRSRLWNIRIPDTHDVREPIYLRVRTNTIMRVPVEIYSTSRVIRQAQADDLAFGLFFGILVAVIIINFFSFLILKRRYFAIYLAYLISLLAYNLRVHGYLYFIPMPFAVLEAALWISLCGVGVFMILFSKSFLSVKVVYPKLNLFFNACIVLFLAQTVIGVAGFSYLANQIAYITGAVVPVAIIGTAVLSYVKGFREARYYLLALIAMFAGTFVWSSAAYIESQVTVNYIFMFGTTMDALLFTLAIFDKIRADLREKEVMSVREQHYRELARTDTLTGLYNRRFIEDEIVRNAEARSAFGDMSLIIIDLDNFKNVNDTWGHLTGDMLLAKLGNRITQNIRKSDIACRYGGDEFLVILPGADIAAAKGVAEKLRESIQNDHFYTETGEEIPYTISIGLSRTRPEDTFEGLFLRADAALYQSKKMGKNKLSVL